MPLSKIEKNDKNMAKSDFGLIIYRFYKNAYKMLKQITLYGYEGLVYYLSMIVRQFDCY